jgi:hypothetical protein
MAITLGATFLCPALVLAHALKDHFIFGLGDFAVYTPSPSRELRGHVREERKALPSPKAMYPGELRVLHLYCASPVDSGVLGSQEFKFDISQWANMGLHVSVCSVVEPGSTPDDVGLTVNSALPPSTNHCVAGVLYADSSRRLLQIAFRLR